MFLIILLSITVVFLTVYYFKFSNKNYWKKRNVVQTSDLMIKFMFGSQSMPEIVKDMYDNYDEPYIGTTSGKIPTLVVKSPEDIQAVLAGDFQNFHSRGIIANPNDLLADNLVFINDYQRWKILRQKLSPVFTSSKLKNMFYILEKCARDFVDVLQDNAEMREKPFNALYTYTTASIGASVFGIDTQTKNTMDSPFLDMAWKTLQPSFHQNIVLLIANIFPIVYKILQLKIFGEYEEFFVGAVKSVLESRRKETGNSRHDFIDICLEIQKQGVMQDHTTGYELEPTDEVLAAQAFFFFIAGADTSATTMHFTLIELSNNPNILKKLHKEIDKVFEEGNGELTYNDIEKMPYLDKVINEAMRKFPPLGVLQRLCSKDTVLPSGLAIEKDNIVMIPVFGLHRDEKYYPNPEIFDPERFSSENDSKMNKFVYLPFGEGNRICIGNRFARLQVKAGLALLLRRFTLVEQNCVPTFEKSPFGLRSPTDRYDLKLRDI